MQNDNTTRLGGVVVSAIDDKIQTSRNSVIRWQKFP
jgi:hypothetical protein